MDSQNSFTDPGRYIAYASATNEKSVLHGYLEQEHRLGRLPIKPGKRGRVLDLGCGTGANTNALAKIFTFSSITAIDRSSQQLGVASTDGVPGVVYVPMPFEDFYGTDYDFVLVSHVLQYIDTNPRSFIKKIVESLSIDGEAWLVQQTRKGMYEIIKHQRDHLTSPRFNSLSRWLAFDDYVRMVYDMGIDYETFVLPMSFQGMDFGKPAENDKLRLEFMLCLDGAYDLQSASFRENLAMLGAPSRIAHPNGIIKIRR